jgi:hypothetical protein
MAFTFKKLLDHGTTNPIVARLSLGVLQILEQCDLAKEARDAIGEIYLNSLVRKLLRCWEIKERFRTEFNAAVESYKPGSAIVPQIPRLNEECHNFLYEAKSFIRDMLGVFNRLYGTQFAEASEYGRGRKNGKSLVEFASATFGQADPRTLFLREAAPGIDEIVANRNAVEHPGGYSGELKISNFELAQDGRFNEPIWHREKDGKRVTEPSSIRADMETIVHNLLTVSEDMLVSWANDHLRTPGLMQIGLNPEGERNPQKPLKYVVTASAKLEEMLSTQGQKKP